MSRESWVAELVSELIRFRPDLTYGFKYAKAVAQNEWARTRAKIDPKVAAKRWNQRVRSASP